MITNTVDITELLWTVCAIPGLWLWILNQRESARDVRAARTIIPRNGRYLWASFSVLLTRMFVGIEVLFVLLGIVAMFRPSPMDPTPVIRYVTVAGLILASAGITWLSYRWKQVNRDIVQAARDRMNTDAIPVVTPPVIVADTDDDNSTAPDQ